MNQRHDTLKLNGSVHENQLPTGFFAYASSPPSIPATIKGAIEGINKTYTATIQSWESLRASGKYLISEICDAIDRADFFCADVTAVNPNVMFELGYAIASNKRVWLIRDESFSDAKREFEQLRLLTTIGFSPYLNSAEIIGAFFADKPHATTDQTIFTQSIEPMLTADSAGGPSLLYLKSRYDTEASVRITRTLETANFGLIINDPNETNIQPLYWYAQKLFDTSGLVTHFVSPAREGFRVHNARYALISGMARGFHVGTLMLTEHSQLLAPIDYRDSMQHYTTPSEAARLTDEWLQPIALKTKQATERTASYVSALRLATELRDFHLELGDYVAENESATLDDYFVETTVSSDLISGTQGVFVGRKGTGKTANLIHAEKIIGADPRNLVCIIKPVGYEIEGLVRLFSSYKLQDHKGYVIESLWKFMLYTEIAQAASRQIEQRALWELTNPETKEFVDFIEDESRTVSGDFIVRLERAVKALSSLPATDTSEAFRKGISESLHSESIGKLRKMLARVLSNKRHVMLLVDNLDKPWTKNADLGQLSEFLLGLLTATNRIGIELNNSGTQRTRFNSAVFLRSDIFERLLTVAREPDKVSYTRLRWEDPEVLLRIIEERYVASHGPGSDPAVMWRLYFCPEVKGIPTREYLTARILKRPRDIVYLVKSAVSFAVNRKHDRVEEKDILDGEKQYSQYALDSILVENGITIPELESVLFEFVGTSSILTEADVKTIIRKGKIPEQKLNQVLQHLIKLSFLGAEVSKDTFLYSDEPREMRKIEVLSERYLGENGTRRYEINAPFRPYLEIPD